MSLADIFQWATTLLSHVGTVVSDIGSAIWHYPFRWDGLVGLLWLAIAILITLWALTTLFGIVRKTVIDIQQWMQKRKASKSD